MLVNIWKVIFSLTKALQQIDVMEETMNILPIPAISTINSDRFQNYFLAISYTRWHSPYWIIRKFSDKNILFLWDTDTMIIKLLIFILQCFRSISFDFLFWIALQKKLIKFPEILENWMNLDLQLSYTIEKAFVIWGSRHYSEFNIFQ